MSTNERDRLAFDGDPAFVMVVEVVKLTECAVAGARRG